jgi:FxsC-like protein
MVNDIEPYFYLSYARTPKRHPNDPGDPDRWVYKLYRDLCENILNMTNAQPGSVGFMDRESRPGVNWSVEVAQALATCRVFVPLYSERYFDSESCGKEWFAFARREVNDRARSRNTSSAIVPALWVDVDPDSLPEVAKSIHDDQSDLGRRYGVEGFYGIMKLQRYRQDYEVAVYQLARRIVEVAHATRVSPEQPTDYASLQSAFGQAGSLGLASDQLQITVLALDTSTLPKGRGAYYYGNTPRTWCPYRPDYSSPLAEYAAALTECFGLQPAVGTFDEHAAHWATDGRPVPPSLCLVDPWAAVSPVHMERLRRLDELEQPWVSVLVPWNSQDAELSAAEQDLRRGLSLSLGRKLEGVPYRCRVAATGIPTLQEFGQLLPQMAMIMLKRFRQDEMVPAYPPEGPRVERPRLRRADPEDSGGSHPDE